jgi:hypothetical protein
MVREGVTLFGHGGAWLDPVARIPLIIRYPKKLKQHQFDHLSEGVDIAPTLLALLGVPAPEGKEFDGVDLTRIIDGKAPPKDHVLVRRAIRTTDYKCIFAERPDVLLAEIQPEPRALDGRLYDLAADPHEMTNVFESRPEVVADLLSRFRSSLAGPFRRYEEARSSEQPDSAFAISARHMVTDVSLPQANGRQLPDGWSRRKQASGALLVASKTDEPLALHCPLPNGVYGLFLRMAGHAVVQVGDQRRELTGGELVEFGDINVADEVFRAIIHPQRDQLVAISFFGFTPAAARSQDPDDAKKHLERLRSLGYVGDP